MGSEGEGEGERSGGEGGDGWWGGGGVSMMGVGGEWKGQRGGGVRELNGEGQGEWDEGQGVRVRGGDGVLLTGARAALRRTSAACAPKWETPSPSCEPSTRPSNTRWRHS